MRKDSDRSLASISSDGALANKLSRLHLENEAFRYENPFAKRGSHSQRPQKSQSDGSLVKQIELPKLLARSFINLLSAKKISFLAINAYTIVSPQDQTNAATSDSEEFSKIALMNMAELSMQESIFSEIFSVAYDKKIKVAFIMAEQMTAEKRAFCHDLSRLSPQNKSADNDYSFVGIIDYNHFVPSESEMQSDEQRAIHIEELKAINHLLATAKQDLDGHNEQYDPRPKEKLGHQSENHIFIWSFDLHTKKQLIEQYFPHLKLCNHDTENFSDFPSFTNLDFFGKLISQLPSPSPKSAGPTTSLEARSEKTGCAIS